MPKLPGSSARTAKARQELLALLNEASWLFGDRAFDGSCCEGLSFIEYQAQAGIRRAKIRSVQDIGKAIRFTKSGATRIVDRLEGQGLVRRRRSATDGRVSPCMGLLHSHKTYLYGLDRRVRAHDFGNVHERDLFDIWNSEAYVRFRDEA